MALFQAVREALGDLSIIAEDLGFVTPEVRKLLEDSGYPGMKVLQFAFDDDPKSTYLPQNYTTTNCVAYTGTHDNMTLRGGSTARRQRPLPLRSGISTAGVPTTCRLPFCG